MGVPQILICEDEAVVAMGIESKLQNLGYQVVETAVSGEEAVQKAELTMPDLVLMDIVLQGEMDGIQAADQIRTQFDIPVIFLTAYSDDKTMERAKITEPFGYLIKPFQDRELHSAIEIALYKHKVDKKLKENQRWLETVLKSIGDGIITVNQEKKITFMNPVAEQLTGWKKEEAMDRDWKEVCAIVRDNKQNSPQKASPSSGFLVFEKDCHLISRDGKKIPIHNGMSPIVDDKGKTTGVVLVIRDISDRVIAEEEIQIKKHQLDAVLNLLDKNN